MSEKYIQLLGAEEVQRAASRMLDAASTMSSAASTIDSALERHRIFLDTWLERFEAAVEKMPKRKPPSEPRMPKLDD
jgi:hypothetical protein